ncbi:MAG: hypothetical protein U9R48_04465 [Chloroflexota bacterium]|nr:hypothetical protein [Chloroflexota bacterium]
MKKSCLFQVFLFAVLVFVATMFLRGYIRGCRGSQEDAAVVGRRVGGSVSSQDGQGEDADESRARGTGIEGLSSLPVSSLMIDAARVRGLAVSERFFFVSSFDPNRRVGYLYKIDRESRGVAQIRTVKEDGRYQLGGLYVSADSLLVPLAGDETDPVSSILTLDTRYLEIQDAFSVGCRIQAVARGADGLIYGYSPDASVFYAWTPTGEEVRKRTIYTEAEYHDVEFLQGSLVCAGVENRKATLPGNMRSIFHVDGQGGVIDVIDPQTFTLLVRHRCYTRTPDQQWVTSRGFAFFDGMFYFVPDEGHFPTLMTYVLDGVTLSEYVPSVGQGVESLGVQ